LSLFVAPTISGTPKIARLPQDSIATISFNVADADGIVTNVIGTILGNPALATITTTLNGTNVTMSVQGNAYGFSTNTLEVIATDNQGFTATNDFAVTMSAEDSIQCPPIGQQTVRAGNVLGPIPFTIGYRSGLPFQGTVRATSDNQKLLPDTNILLQQTGTGSYTLTAFLVGAQPGSVNITISVDGILTATCTFNVLVQEPGIPLFFLANPITINPGSASTPYPSTNKVEGLIGTIERVAVTLFNITVPAPGNDSLLMVGPSGTNVLLMAGAGGGNSLAGTTLIFDDSVTNGLPSSSAITSGVYQPTVFGPVTAMLPPAPAEPYGTRLAAFDGANPNGDWLLYIMDSGSSRGGVIAGGWQLSIQTAPSIPPIKDQFTDENISTSVVITMGDNQPGVNTTVTASGDPILFQPVTVSGSGATRTLSISPQPYRSGTNIITVVATDSFGMSATQTFSMGVRAVLQSPVFVTTPRDQFIPPTIALGPLPLQIWSPQGSALSVTAKSDNLTLVPTIEIALAESNNGTNNYNLFLIPAGDLTGTAKITILTTDIVGLYSETTFQLYVQGDIFSRSSQSILIPPGPTGGDLQQGVATPFPSTISVGGLGGVISSVHAILVGLTHSFPSDLDLLLVGPDNTTAVMLMSHAGVAGPVNGLRLEFHDGWSPIPRSAPLTSGVYAPADYSSGLTLPSPAPGRPYSTNLSVFNGFSPNGDWKLYVLDDTYPDGGSIDNGWLLYFDVIDVPRLSITQNGTVLRISFAGSANRSYGIQSTVDLSTWSDAGSVLTDVNGSAEFDVNIDPSSGGRFYRVVVGQF
jgi:subtilisin-like proprotein convertase family protein